MKRFYIILLVVSLGHFCNGQDTLKNDLNKYYPVNQLRSDFIFFRAIIENAHPSLYRYAPKDTLDRYFNTTLARIDHPLNTIEYWQMLQNILARMGSGHTDLTPGKIFLDQYNSTPHSILPFSIYIRNNRLFVKAAGLRKTDTIFKPGDEILVINNERASSIVAWARNLVTGDGYSNSFKDYRLQAAFNRIYNLIHGDQYQFLVTFMEGEKVKKNLIKAIKVQYRNPNTVKNPNSVKVALHELTYPADIPSTAILKIRNFTYNDYEAVHENIFKELKKNAVKNLVIDLRDNPGGEENVSIDLMQYIMKHEFYFHIGQEGVVDANRFKYIIQQFKKSAGPPPLDLLSAEHHFFLNQHTGNFLQPLARNAFKGNVYLLINGGTFSAAALFAVAVKKQMACTIIGEETGGGLAGCDGGTILSVTLPNTLFNLTVPVLWTYSVYQERNYGTSLKPDIEFLPQPTEMRYRTDSSPDPIMAPLKEAIIAADNKAK